MTRPIVAAEHSTREYLAECFWPGVTEADLNDIDTRARESAEASATKGWAVSYIGSLLLPGDEVLFCFFEGPSATAVEAVAKRAAIPFSRILESISVPSRARRMR